MRLNEILGQHQNCGDADSEKINELLLIIQQKEEYITRITYESEQAIESLRVEINHINIVINELRV